MAKYANFDAALALLKSSMSKQDIQNRLEDALERLDCTASRGNPEKTFQAKQAVTYWRHRLKSA